METTLNVEKYVRKPLYVDAVQITEENFSEVARWCMGEIRNIGETPVDPSADPQPTKQYIRVRVHSPRSPKQTQATVGDWILYTPMGYKVYTERPFQQNFEKIEDAPPIS